MKESERKKRGDLQLECSFKITSEDETVVDLKNDLKLAYCLKEKHLITAEQRFMEAMNFMTGPVLVEVIAFLNEKIDNWQKRKDESDEKGRKDAEVKKSPEPEVDFREFIGVPEPSKAERKKAVG